MHIVHDDEYYRSRIPQPDLGPLRNFLRFVWDSKTKTLLGRTAKEWGLLLFFYLCFFSVLGSLFALQMWISIYYVSKLDAPAFSYSEPKAYLKDHFPYLSQLDFGSPGIGFNPNILTPLSSPIVWVDNSSVNARPARYVKALTDVLQEYNKSKKYYKSATECKNEISFKYEAKPCFFNIKDLGVCGKPPYGYMNPLQPCILIKFNKRFNWIPDYYNKSSTLPENMPHSLQKMVQSSDKLQIWLWCVGAKNVDKEHVGEIEYIPGPGFPVQYFPFTGQSDYLSPIVALRFKNITRRLVTVKCSSWARNIDNQEHHALDFQIILKKS